MSPNVTTDSDNSKTAIFSFCFSLMLHLDSTVQCHFGILRACTLSPKWNSFTLSPQNEREKQGKKWTHSLGLCLPAFPSCWTQDCCLRDPGVIQHSSNYSFSCHLTESGNPTDDLPPTLQSQHCILSSPVLLLLISSLSVETNVTNITAWSYETFYCKNKILLLSLHHLQNETLQTLYITYYVLMCPLLPSPYWSSVMYPTFYAPSARTLEGSNAFPSEPLHLTHSL